MLAKHKPHGVRHYGSLPGASTLQFITTATPGTLKSSQRFNESTSVPPPRCHGDALAVPSCRADLVPLLSCIRRLRTISGICVRQESLVARAVVARRQRGRALTNPPARTTVAVVVSIQYRAIRTAGALIHWHSVAHARIGVAVRATWTLITRCAVRRY